MNKCKQCCSALPGRKQAFCSDKCRMAYNRQNKTPQDGSGLTNPNKPEQQYLLKVEQTKPEHNSNKPANYGQPGCQCQHCQSIRINKSKVVLNHGAYKPAKELDKNELNRVSLPGDVDYV